MLKIDEIAESLYAGLGINNFELTFLTKKSTNNIYIYEDKFRSLIIKEFIESKKLDYSKNKNKRYNSELFSLETCEKFDLAAPKIKYKDRKLHILAIENINGEVIETINDSNFSYNTCYLLGAWIKRFHEIFDSVKFETSIKNVIGYENLASAGYNSDLTNFLHAHKLPDIKELKLSRNDCHLGNFMEFQQSVIGIDFELCTYLPPEMEIATLLFYISRKFKKFKIHEIKEVLIDGYQPLLREEFSITVEFFYLWKIQQLNSTRNLLLQK
jgi:hypothetical protein